MRMDITDCLVSCTCGREPSPISQDSKFYLPIASSPPSLADCMVKQSYSGPSKPDCSNMFMAGQQTSRIKCGMDAPVPGHLGSMQVQHVCAKAMVKNDLQYKPNQRLRVKPRDMKGEQKGFDCRVCERVFPSQSMLDKHIRNHDEYRPHKCPMCNKGFKQPSHLQQHLRTHSDERPFPCDICNKSFKQSCQLKQHVRLHTEEKPYHCPECDRSFKQASHLNQHVRLHTGEKPYKCQHCDRTFTQASQLRSHKKTHEPKSERKGAGRKPKPLAMGTDPFGGVNVTKPIPVGNAGLCAQTMVSPGNLPNSPLVSSLQSLKTEGSFYTKSSPFLHLGSNPDGSSVRVVHVAELPVSTIVPHI